MEEKLHNKHGYVCTVLDCKAAFSKSWKLEAHLCKHTGLRPFSCRNCDKSFCTRYQLTRHELSHSGEKPHTCPAEGCSEAFVTSASMKNHMARVHLHQERRYQCDHQGCKKDFNKRNQLKAHKFEHGEPLPFHGCTKEFSTYGKLKHHKRVHEGYPCGAEPCPFWAKTWSEYLKHREHHKAKVGVHTKEKMDYLCSREGCDKKFSRLFRLKNHVLGDHEGKKPFSCPDCGKSFAVKETLWRHSKMHNPAMRKKRHPKKDQAAQVTESAAANQEETSDLTTKLQNTTLEDDDS
ncbi:general transcription factor IIIA, b isoform X2 [Kryptolebias marmoratus]|uniref:general transcription factor IIIA, b isoform X2 n=1 Tax=Kryptolebias marmoratus TaxID=37003 RepID=UPI0007F90C2E|nr:general transcription factor IIIA, b isoform X2 [Kryptolebias marmoratus]